MARLRDIVIDAAHPASLARFWAAALDDYDVAPYDEAELARLAANGITDPEDDPTVLIEPRGQGPRLWCQRVPEPRRVKNRVHLDMTCADRDGEAERLIGWGARVVERHPDHLLLADPEGNEFCLFGAEGSVAG
ncbi:VOC family protein [Streptomyces profundus]|uniref:VOC family protein n=1 Tax=Streptomyces profundus TaxID=2867410 RepID=UPI001D16713D|nr:VOC family protein [Streptomyces sp. MA3_2.13]UED88096.1 VOC family protein [Streptomyces sp. MA3_2.13]